jgi:hypothetical protein
MNDAHAPTLACDGSREKIAQGLLGFGDGEAVQIEFGFDTIMTAPQATHHRILNSTPTKGELVAEFDIKVRWRQLQTVLENFGLSETTEKGARFRFRTMRTDARLAAQRACTLDRIAKSPDIFVGGLAHPATSNPEVSVYCPPSRVSKKKTR